MNKESMRRNQLHRDMFTDKPSKENQLYSFGHDIVNKSVQNRKKPGPYQAQYQK